VSFSELDSSAIAVVSTSWPVAMIWV